MIFTRENAELVMSGRKTQTRRIVKPGEVGGLALGHYLSVNTVMGKAPKYELGQTLAVQPGRGKKALGRIRITEIRRERVQEISEEDARAEGAHAIEWTESHPVQISDNEWDEGLVTMGSYRYGFEEIWQGIYAGQKGKQWADNPEVWALTFEVVRQECKHVWRSVLEGGDDVQACELCGALAFAAGRVVSEQADGKGE